MPAGCSFRYLFAALVLWLGIYGVQAVEQADSLMLSDSLILKELVVSAAAQPMQMKGDTLMYDVSSFRVPEGSRLRELLQKMPGIEVTADGVVTAQGRPVQRILLNGKEFFAGNKQLVLDNLPAEILQTIKVYRKEDERDADTGMRSDEGEQVIDVITQPDKSSGWFAELLGGGGTRRRYQGNASLNRFDDRWQNMLTASWDNVPGRGLPGMSYHDKMSTMTSPADTRKQNYSAMVNRMTDGLRLGASAYYMDTRSEGGMQTVQEQLLPGNYAYTSGESETESTGRVADASLTVEWSDSLTSVYLDPHVGFNRSVSYAQSRSRTYNAYPLAGTGDSGGNGLVNDSRTISRSEYTGVTATLSGRVNRKLGRRGRNIDVSFRLGLDDGRFEANHHSDITYYNRPMPEQTLQYSEDGQRHYVAEADVAYTEPLSTCWRLQLRYGVGYIYDKADQSVYSGEAQVYDERLSRKAKNEYLNQEARLLAQYEYGGFRLLFGADARPQHVKTGFRRYGIERDTVRTLFDMAPEIMLMYRKDNHWNASFNYVGRSRRPDLFSLIPIEDESDPLNRSIGNPALRPSFSHQLTASLTSFDVERQQQLSFGCSASFERNALVQRVVYDAQTGGRLTMPDNVSGNRSFYISGNYTSSFKPFGPWHLDEQFEWQTSRRVGLQAASGGDIATAAVHRYTTHDHSLTENLGVEYSRGVFSVRPYGYFVYNMQRSPLSDERVNTTWQYGYGGLLRCETDFGLTASLDVYDNCRKGFSGDGSNGHEAIVNADVAYAFLKGRKAVLRLRGCDLLRQARHVKVSRSPLFRTEVHYKRAVSGFLMLSFTYRLDGF